MSANAVGRRCARDYPAVTCEDPCKGARYERIADVQTDREKDAPIAHAPEHGSRRIPEHVSHAPGIPAGLDFDRIVGPERKLEQGTVAEDHGDAINQAAEARVQSL